MMVKGGRRGQKMHGCELKRQLERNGTEMWRGP